MTPDETPIEPDDCTESDEPVERPHFTLEVQDGFIGQQTDDF